MNKGFVSCINRLVSMLIVFVFISTNLVAQELERVILTVAGQGTTKDFAVQSALRDAIESTYGAFISSNSKILNDELIKDEIVSVTNGNIENYDILSEAQLPDGTYTVTIRTSISLNKLKSFTKNKGFEVEFDGASFAMNIKLQKFNEEQEYKTILNMIHVLEKILYTSFDYTIEASEPTLFLQEEGMWKIPLKVGVRPNANFKNFHNYLYQTLKGISLTIQEKDDYVKLNKPVYTVFLINGQKQNYKGDFVQTFESKDRKYMEFHLGGSEVAGLQYNGNNIGLSYRSYKKKRARELLLASESKQERKEREKREKSEVKPPITYGEIINEIARDSDEIIKSFFDFDLIFLRQETSLIALKNLIHKTAYALQNFEIDDGLSKEKIDSFEKGFVQNGKLRIYDSFLVDDWFRIVLSKRDRYQSKASILSLQNEYDVRANFSNERDEFIRINTVAALHLNKLKIDQSRNGYTKKNPFASGVESNTQEMVHLGGSLSIDLNANSYSLTYILSNYNERDEMIKATINQSFPFWPLFGIYTLTDRDYFESIKALIQSKNSSVANELIGREYLDKFSLINPMLSNIMFLSFLNYTNEEGYSSLYYLEDYKTLQELEKVKGYTVSPIKN